MKVGIVGAGAVGSACFLSMVMRGSAREVVLVNRDRKRAKGVGRTSNTARSCRRRLRFATATIPIWTARRW
jgi:malate/lactate dehydrogenase